MTGWGRRFLSRVSKPPRAAVLSSLCVVSIVSIGLSTHQSRAEPMEGPDTVTETSQRGTSDRQEAVRGFLETSWDTLFVIGGSLEDTLLLKPRIFESGNEHLYVYDYFDDRLRAFDMSGGLTWTFGRSGEGPGEFSNAFDVEVGPRGNIWVVDAGASRITVVSPSGDLVRTIPLAGAIVRDVIPLSDRILVTPVSPNRPFWMAIDSMGATTVEGAFPDSTLRSAHWLHRQPQVDQIPSRGNWVAMIPNGNMFYVYQELELRCRGTLIEGEPLPESSEADPPVWAVAEAAADSSVYILAKGKTEHSLQVIDIYSLSDCEYRNSVRLPREFNVMTVDDGRFFLEYEEPAPTIVGLRPSTTTGPS